MIVQNSRIKQSNDARYGMEFSYSFWTLIRSSNYGYRNTTECKSNDESTLNLRHILHKGNTDISNECNENGNTNTPLLQFPGIWLDSKTNTMHFVINTEKSPNRPGDDDAQSITLSNLPIDKWVHITFILINNNVDLYVNCNLKKRYTLKSVPKYNHGDLYITSYGGFLGYISKLRYYNYALEPFDILQQCEEKPDSITDVIVDSGVEPPYLADDYWTNTDNDVELTTSSGGNDRSDGSSDGSDDSDNSRVTNSNLSRFFNSIADLFRNINI